MLQLLFISYRGKGKGKGKEKKRVDEKSIYEKKNQK